MKVKVHGASAGLELADDLFAARYNEPLIHQVVTAYMAGARQGTKAQKRRSDARGGGIKPWRQKGTGRARAGTSRSPIWVGGGRAFAAAPRDHSVKVNRKMYRAALRSVLSELIRQERVRFANEITVSEPRTRELKPVLDELGLQRGLIVVEAFDENLWLAARNLPGLFIETAAAVSPYALVAAEQVVITTAAARLLEERMK
ncbi:MAG: 50S ribosomal protein L4 [Gammaproteobacteria bacterium]|jgi:large subunit ribosomal protein L4